MTRHKSRAKIIVNPYRGDAKKAFVGERAVVELDGSIAHFYREMLINTLVHPKWLIGSRKIHAPKWRSHITFLDGRVRLNEEQIKKLSKYHNTYVEFEYGVSPYKHWKFWALPVYSKQLEAIRAELGLNPKYHFHITIAREE